MWHGMISIWLDMSVPRGRTASPAHVQGMRGGRTHPQELHRLVSLVRAPMHSPGWYPSPAGKDKHEHSIFQGTI